MEESRAQVSCKRVAPSEIKQFMRVRRCLRRSFTTTEFAAHFEVSPTQAREVLNEYAADGLMTFVDRTQDGETWAASRDGQYVFSPIARQFLKRDINRLKEALKNLEDLAEDVLEISLGGRPVLGKRHGKVVIGVRFGHEPYTRREHELVVSMLAERGYKAFASHRFAVLPFHDKMPGRLKERLVLTGQHVGEIHRTPHERLDAEEQHQLRYCRRLLTPQVVERIRRTRIPSAAKMQEVQVPHDILWSTLDDLESSGGRIQCTQSAS
jgi:hypothetical protein